MEKSQTMDAGRCTASALGLSHVVILAGQVRTSPLTSAIKRSLLDLPISNQRKILDLWQHHLTNLAADLALSSLTVRVLVDQDAPLPSHHPSGSLPLRIERDPKPLRGTGGLLHDVACDLDPNSYLLVAHGPQLLLEPLTHLTRLLAAPEAEVAILTQGDDAPCGLMLIRCGILRQIQSVGFVDLREQALPHIARSHRVHIVPTAGQALLPTRTREDYIRALRLHAAQERGLDLAAFDHPFAESWQTSFAIVEPGAVVHPSARIHDSVVLAGARVGREALVAYSVVGPGGVVPPRGTLVNEVLGAARPPADRS